MLAMSLDSISVRRSSPCSFALCLAVEATASVKRGSTFRVKAQVAQLKPVHGSQEVRLRWLAARRDNFVVCCQAGDKKSGTLFSPSKILAETS
jgi:hypothetical protein